MISGTPAIPARVAMIEQRMSQVRGSNPSQSQNGAPLGFAMILEQQAAAANSAPQSSTSLDWANSGFSAGGTGRTPAVQRSPGEYGPLSPPAELIAHGNGTIPASALQPVGIGGHRLWGPAAAGLNALVSDAARDGVVIGITDTYRPIETQQQLAEEKGLYNQGGLAAVPGTSNHGWGVATDLDLDVRGLDWMRKNAWQYGFVEDVPREPWHWTYRAEP